MKRSLKIWPDHKPDVTIKRRQTSSFLPAGCYALLTATGPGFNDSVAFNLCA